ncbi:M56 family metallopeptidase [Myxacorys almedinensis]|uniref:M56 family peptidase n=1 Tax=Myxacorys almedinensis A TaxID=2690445 RepID=A0A8J7Z2E9_9CYAN|nr:M56 family metallopeptidase [Myxacorys almedinensis]NDJ18429.1 M56 family peptidase [Myxacorys almedinensis A]
MHLVLLMLALSTAIAVRFTWKASSEQWTRRWNWTLGVFLFSPLLVMMSAIAILCMGPKGQMVRWWEGWGSYAIAVGFLAVGLGLAVNGGQDALRSLRRVRDMPQHDVQGVSARLLAQPTPFVAQIGFWQPELVISQGLLETLDPRHLDVVLMHEEAHAHYRDTFWFFWLGWLRRLTAWLPQTEALWQELLILRELRADRWAAQRVDPLLLAEALLSVVSASQIEPDDLCAAFSSAVVKNRLTERIEALLDESESSPESSFMPWLWLLMAVVPMAIVPFHF